MDLKLETHLKISLFLSFFLGSVIALSQSKEKQNSGYVSDLKNN